jgi:hypothetical protein
METHKIDTIFDIFNAIFAILIIFRLKIAIFLKTNDFFVTKWTPKLSPTNVTCVNRKMLKSKDVVTQKRMAHSWMDTAKKSIQTSATVT